MLKKTITSLLIMGMVFSTMAVAANAEGIAVSGWKHNSDNTWSYADAQGVYKNQWYTEAGKTYYFKEDGTMAVGLTSIGGKTYCFNQYGELLKGWYSIDGPWYFFDRTTGELVY